VTAQILLPVVLTSAVILILAGVAKLVRPAAATTFLETYSVPKPRLIVRAGASFEVMAGIAAFAEPRLAGVAIALLYGSFAALVAMQMRRRNATSCGCFGRSDIRPSYFHLGVNVLGATAGLLALLATPPAWTALATGDTLAAVVVVVTACIVAVMTQELLVLFPSTFGAWEGAGAHG
jgi:uncharacterized membrane protein HdeD (DUF308 family)